jgi:tetratricopeptide (TPR) repeat protein
MFDRVRLLLPVAGLALVVGALAPRPSTADMIQLSDGKWQPWPDNVPMPPPGDAPSSDALATSEETTIADATYEAVKLSGKVTGTRPAAQVTQLLSFAAMRSEAYKQAMNDGSSALWVEAADGFRAAAGELTGYAKQDALYKAMQAAANTGDPSRAMGAVEELLSAFPKSYYLCDAHVLKAKILMLTKNDVAGASAALDAVKAAAGMNVRDAFRAQYMKAFLTLEAQKKYEEAASEYRVLIGAMDREKDVAAVQTTKQRCQVGLGSCLLATRKVADARGQFEAATESRDADVLAGAYAGLGDVAFTEAKALRDGGKLPEAKAKLENEAVLHYLRVSLKYRTDVTDDAPVLRSMENVANVFIVLFEMSGSKDFDAADRACKVYAELVRMLPEGSAQRRAVVRSYTDIAKRRDALKPAPAKN